jgi:hypothetical protein
VHQLSVALAVVAALVLLPLLQRQQQHPACLGLPPAAAPQLLVHLLKQLHLQPAAPLRLGALVLPAHQQQLRAQHLLLALAPAPAQPQQRAQASILPLQRVLHLQQQLLQHLLQQLALASGLG